MSPVKILIVEDDPAMVDLLSGQLKRLDYTVDGVVANADQALQSVAETAPDLVLMDIMLEGERDGIRAAEEIRRRYQTPVVFITAHEEDEILQQAKLTDPFGYLLKPFQARELWTTLEIALHLHRMDRILRESEERYQSIINSSLDMIVAVDNERRIIEFNPAAEESFGYRREEVLGRHVNLLYADHQVGLAVYRTTLKNGRGIQEIQNRQRDGSVFPTLLASSVLKDPRGNQVGVMGISRDISELKAAEQAARETQEALKTSQQYALNIIDSSLDMIITVDNDRRITQFNASAEKAFGYQRAEVIGQNVSILYADPQEGMETHEATLKEGKFTHEILNRRKNGEVFPSLLSASVLRDDKGQLLGVMGVSRDITETKRAREELQRSEEKYRVLAEELAQTNDMKELLLDVITHDLKNPAGVISGMSELMVSENPEEECVQLVKASSDNLLRVIENATTLAKVSMDEEIEREEIDLVEVIQETAGEFTHALKNAGVDLEYQLPGRLPVRANPIIAEIFKNYISNAIKYASAGKKIVIEGQRGDNQVIVGVKDFGRSIPKKDYQKAFERGIQLNKSGKRGRGLGLAIVKRIAEAHGGMAWVESNKPRGNIFYLQLPVG